jgi:leader peptidase (prepilin peptidase)/N-methyltransferase
LNGFTLLIPAFDHWLWLIPVFLIGACIGSFLNVVIYRVPLGMSVNEPKRSFCPKCREPIPMWLNIPVLSWLWLRGRCAKCGCKISVRYPMVELLTALGFLASWKFFPPHAAVFLWVLVALLVAISFIDADHLIIPVSLTWAGSAVGVLAAIVWPTFPRMAGGCDSWREALIQSGIGWAAGFFGLWLVVELGKLAFGKKAMKFQTPAAWELKEPAGESDPLSFVIDGESIPWWDLFSRKSDRLIIETGEIRVDGERHDGGKLVIRETEIELPNGAKHSIEKLRSLSGTATSVVIPREAMGFGDVHLMGMIGAFFGWSGVLFALFASSIYALIAALIGRIGFGRQLPFGPFLAMGALTWAFGGWKLWAWYLEFLGPLWQR